MSISRRNFAKAAAAAAIVGMAGIGVNSSAYADTITGAGSSWVYPLVSKWAAAYHTQTGIAVNYASIGSGGGIKQIEGGVVAFGASDMPLTPENLAKHDLIQFPTAIAGEDLVYNLPGVKAGEVILSGPVVADIYMGKIKKWDDPAIAKLNPGFKLPDMGITVVHRSDGSGTTFTFADYLSKVSPEWKSKLGANTVINWPAGVGGKGNEGVSTYVQQIKGSIGYVEYAYILESKLNYARMVNSAGKVVSPEPRRLPGRRCACRFHQGEGLLRHPDRPARRRHLADLRLHMADSAQERAEGDQRSRDQVLRVGL